MSYVEAVKRSWADERGVELAFSNGRTPGTGIIEFCQGWT
ncbi:hypothetical protein MGWOODY_Clf1960 [hydrothermal vent metagenome]|uniref:Uncharacterized protein n=1 Tax=hydrothermal vent metagenome TaxID=652676 RepID=A0A161KFY5_9ZZZZ